jgi:lipoprotein-releasing system ATP-binding protein
MSDAGQTPLIECRDLRKSYLETAAPVDVLKGVDLAVYQGDMLAIVGISGVGKTTLLYVLGLLERPSGGQILFEGRDIFTDYSEKTVSDYRNRKIGFVFQFHHLIPEFDVLENVMMPAIIAGEPRKAAMDKAKESLSLLGVAHRASHKPGEISGGEQQRVAVARALVMQPKMVLADEPTGNLDVETAERIHDEFQRLNGKIGTTFIVVTHNEHLAGNMKRVVRLSGGKASIEK